jgi:NADH-ubiquinone oxidoreductase chain 4L
MTYSLILFTIGFIGFVLNRENVISMIISLELMLLAATIMVLLSSISFNDNTGQFFAIMVITVAGAESVIALSLLVGYYKLRNNIIIS